MLSKVGWKRHLIVLAVVMIVPVLVLVGWLGGGRYPERFDQKQVVVAPTTDGEGVRITEIVDQDFGSHDRHGYQRIVPNDFGAPTDVEAYTFVDGPPSYLWISDFGSETQMRIGDPDVEITGQHRFELAYTLPEARLGTGRLDLDIIDPGEEFETGRFEVVLTGFDLSNPVCQVGRPGDERTCTLSADGDDLRVVFEPLRAGDGITVRGDVDGLREPSSIDPPALPDRRASQRLLGAGVLAVLGLLTAGVVYVLMARRGRNEVGGDGAADAAHAADGPTRLVSDRELDSMATTEFAPPRGLHPWQGAVLLDEAVTQRSVSAWFAEQIARDVLVLEEEPNLRLTKGDAWKDQDVRTEQYVRDLFASGDTLVLSKYQPTVKTVWDRINADQQKAAKEAGWWSQGGALHAAADHVGLAALYVVGLPILVVATFVLAVAGLMDSWLLCGVVTVLLALAASAAAYSPLTARRSAAGSALALRTESFRRFLASSEGQHVEWAWERGVVREYTAWAVALGAAAAWGKAIDESAVAPQVNQALVAPSVFERSLLLILAASTPPSVSSSGGSSGSSSSGFSSFSGGFSSSVGGGGGGGSSGSW